MIGNMTEIADVFGIGRSTLDGWIRRGCPGEKINNTWVIDSVKVFSWVVHDGKEELDLVQEKARESIKRQKKLDLEIEEKEGRLIDREKVKEIWGAHIMAAKAKLLSLPTKMTPELLGQDDLLSIKKIIKKHVYEALNELADGH